MSDYMNPPINTNDSCYILAYDDHADGNTYLAEDVHSTLANAFVASLRLLADHDNVCIITPEDYDRLDHEFYTVAPYAINLSCGIYAAPTRV